MEDLIRKLQDRYIYVDLTHGLDDQAPSWNGSCGFVLENKLDYQECATPTKFRVQQIKMHAGIGTHMDAPAHCFAGTPTVGELFLEMLLFVPLYVIDVRAKVEGFSGYGISVEDIKEQEHRYGIMPDKAFVVGYTGWCNRWSDSIKYRNADTHGTMKFPYFKGDVTDYLLGKNIVGIGIDTLSPDNPADETFPIHHNILKEGKFIVENIANLEKVIQKESWCLIVPPKITYATEAPVRVIALIKKEEGK